MRAIFPLIHYGGSFFFPPSFHFSPHGAGRDLSRCLMSSQAASASFCLSAAAGSVGCKRGTVDRGCAVSKGVPCLCELNKPSVTRRLPDLLCGRGLLAYGIEEMAPGKLCLSACLSSKGEPAVPLFFFFFNSCNSTDTFKCQIASCSSPIYIYTPLRTSHPPCVMSKRPLQTFFSAASPIS